MTTPVRETISLIGEVHCLNCGRTLAEVVHDGSDGRHLLRPAAHQEVIEVKLIGPRALQCRRCGGRAMVEPFEQPTEELVRRPRHQLRGAA
jgi:DNA-directed RNA polymerase subunit RPC12/RpoP